jgi:hypothetical protein
MTTSEHNRSNRGSTAAYRVSRKDTDDVYLPFSSAVAVVCEKQSEVEAEGSDADSSWRARDRFVAGAIRTLIGALSRGELCACIDTTTGLRQIPSNFWSFGSVASRASAEVRLLGERETTIEQWASLMGRSYAGYDLAIAPCLNRRDLKRWARRLRPAGDRPKAAHRKQVIRELIAICRDGEGRLINADVRCTIKAKLGAEITDHCWKLAKREAKKSEPKVRARFVVGAPKK